MVKVTFRFDFSAGVAKIMRLMVYPSIRKKLAWAMSNLTYFVGIAEGAADVGINEGIADVGINEGIAVVGMALGFAVGVTVGVTVGV